MSTMIRNKNLIAMYKLHMIASDSEISFTLEWMYGTPNATKCFLC